MKLSHRAVVAMALCAGLVAPVAPANAADLSTGTPAASVLSGSVPSSARLSGATWTLPGAMEMHRAAGGQVRDQMSLAQAVRRWQRLARDGRSVVGDVVRDARVLPMVGVPTLDSEGDVTVRVRKVRERVASLPLTSSEATVYVASCPEGYMVKGTPPAYYCAPALP